MPDKRVGEFDVSIYQEVLPRNQCLIEDQHRVVLIEAARERMIEGLCAVQL